MNATRLCFSKRYSYPGNIDPEVFDLCNAINALPGLQTLESCCGHGERPLAVYFKASKSFDGLFFLTRCVDHRYFEYGNLWKIELSVGDVMRESVLPTIFCLNSGIEMGEVAYYQAKVLVDNMNDHLNIPKFLEIFNLDLNRFDI
jgi:hypothetical protein